MISSVRRAVVLGLAVLVPVAATCLWVLREWGEGDGPARPAPTVGSASPSGSSERAGVLTRVRVRPDRVLRVRQWVTSSEPMTSLVLVAPVDPHLESGTVTATRLRVSSGGARVVGPTQVTLDSAAFAFDKTQSVHLSYLLTGALQRSPGSSRALARVTALDLYARPEVLPTTYVFRGARILSLACTPLTSSGPPQTCGSKEGRAWTVRLERPTTEQYRVMVQLDLSPRLVADDRPRRR